MASAVLDKDGRVEALGGWGELVPPSAASGPLASRIGAPYRSLFDASVVPRDGSVAAWLAGVDDVLHGAEASFELPQGLALGGRTWTARAIGLPQADGRVLITLTESGAASSPDTPAGRASAKRNPDQNHVALDQSIVFGRMVEFASQAIGSADLDGRLCCLNPAMVRLLGIPSADVAPRYHYEDFYREEDLSFLRGEVMSTVLAMGKWSGEIPLRPLRGEPLSTIQTINLLRDGEGRPIGFTNVITDITEQKRVENALRRSEAKYRQLFEENLDGIALADAATGILLDCNEALCRMTGRSRAELIGQPQRILHPAGADDGAVTASFDLHRNGRGAEVPDDQLVTASGEIRDVEIKAKPFELNGRTVLQGIFRDVTERKRAEASLAKRISVLTQPPEAGAGFAFEDLFNLEDIQRLQDLFADAFGVASLITAPDGTPITRPSRFCDLCANIVRASPIGEKNCNRSDAQIGRHNPAGPIVQSCLSAGLCNAGASITVGGRHIANWLIGQVRSENQDEKQIVGYANAIGVDESAFRMAYRKVRFMPQAQFEKVAEVLFEMANQISNAAYQNLQQARVIAERQRAENALKELNATLERRVKEVVAKNREKDHLLIQQSRLAAMGEMIANIAHQWRQPINALALLLANIKDAYQFGDLDAAYLSRQIEHGNGLIQRMSATIDDFRNYFKPNRARQPFQLSAIVRDALSIVESAFNSHHITIEVDVRHDATAAGFPNEYTQVLLNLLSNAKDAIEARGTTGGRVTVTIDREPYEARLTVADNGGGIAPEIIPKVFDPYFTTRESGTGIGLYMSKMIIETNMNGRIEVRNGLQGAEVSIITPVSDASSAVPPDVDPD